MVGMVIPIGAIIRRLSPSSTGRAIVPGNLGKVGGLYPQLHENPPQFDDGDLYFPVQWRSGLWSSMDPMDRGVTWEFNNKKLKLKADLEEYGRQEPEDDEDDD